jgi:hypothetical protein
MKLLESRFPETTHELYDLSSLGQASTGRNVEARAQLVEEIDAGSGVSLSAMHRAGITAWSEASPNNVFQSILE